MTPARDRQAGSTAFTAVLPASIRTLLIVLGLLVVGCSPPAPEPSDGAIRISGTCMGTTWSLVAVPGGGAERTPPTADALARVVQHQLDEVDEAMSTWRQDSELSRFNRLSAGESQTVGDETAHLVLVSQEIWERTAGAFDPSVGPLVEAWGFGAEGRDTNTPDDAELEALLETVGLDGLSVEFLAGRVGQLTKHRAGLALDLSAIAKGFAVDEAARALASLGLDGYFVEVGGEVKVHGRSPRGDRWRVGIDLPGAAQRQVAAALSPGDGAVATSGDYRNWRLVDGEQIGHTLDPRTGRPVSDPPASATVVGPSCATADAYATALMVLGPDEGLPLIEAMPEYEALILMPGPTAGEGREFVEHTSSGFADLRVSLPSGN